MKRLDELKSLNLLTEEELGALKGGISFEVSTEDNIQVQGSNGSGLICCNGQSEKKHRR